MSGTKFEGASGLAANLKVTLIVNLKVPVSGCKLQDAADSFSWVLSEHIDSAIGPQYSRQLCLFDWGGRSASRSVNFGVAVCKVFQHD